MKPKPGSTEPRGSEARFAYEGLDRVIHERARLSILTSLITNSKGLTFVDLKQLCGLTDGNLSRHLSVLETATMVQIVKGAGDTAILATVTPNLESTEAIDRLSQLNSGIRGVAAARGVRLVDMYAAFNNNPGLLNPDGFHPNNAGTQLIAQKFYGAVR